MDQVQNRILENGTDWWGGVRGAKVGKGCLEGGEREKKIMMHSRHTMVSKNTHHAAPISLIYLHQWHQHHRSHHQAHL